MEVSWRSEYVGRARVAMNAKQERIKRVYPLLMPNDDRFLRAFLYFSMYQSILASKTENRQRIWKIHKGINSVEIKCDRLNTTHKLVSMKRDRL